MTYSPLVPPPVTMTDELIRKARRVRDAFPQGGLFAQKEWRVSPEPFPLSRSEFRRLEALGPILLRYQRSSDLLYRRSRKGNLPAWIADYLDRGKPIDLIETGLAHATLDETPRVIRPDLILTASGFTAVELDSVPGGIGLTAWLGETYAQIDNAYQIIGGATGMADGFSSIFRSDKVDLLVSREAADYRPEMEWLSEKKSGNWSILDAENYSPSGRDVYRFFELFDLPNLPGIGDLMAAAASGKTRVTAPFKPWIEEKLWSALLWSRPLRPLWTRELREANLRRLLDLIPQSWVVDPAEVPHHAVIPGLEINGFSELKTFTQKERALVLKLSGFGERAWGSRSVTMGQDVSQTEWGQAVDEAIESFPTAPFVLQRFHPGKIVTHPWWNPDSDQIEIMEGRVRLCPYYFVSAKVDSVRLGGVLATICPADKKILHGMRDAILVPCRVEG